MKLRETSECPNCKPIARRLAKLEQQLADMLQRIDKLEQENTRLRDENSRLRDENTQIKQQLAAARKNSSTSSKPPSSDIVKPKKRPAKGGKKRKRGGQPGHKRHERPEFPPGMIDKFFSYTLNGCPDCGGELLCSRKADPRVVQQAELVAKPLRISEHRGLSYWCPHCRKVHYAPLPAAVEKTGLFGPKLTTLVAFMKGVCHTSFSTIRKFFRDVVGIKVSRGYLAKLIAKVSRWLGPAYDELLARLPDEACLNVDETGHKENAKKFWTWCFRAELYTLFRIEPTRSSQVLIDTLGEEFNGVLGCDYFGAYRKYMRKFGVLIQFCLAHLIRDVKFLATLPDKKQQGYGKRVREALRELFAVIHRREKLSEAGFAKKLGAVRAEVIRVATTRVPQGKHARNLAKRFHKHGEAYFQFITTPGIEPTNNLAEQAIRFVVIDRRITQGTRSETGRRWCERIWTTIATCAQQGRSVFEFLLESVQSHLRGAPPPSLMPSGP
ncbi:MAG: IS66 family transposase [Pseudomonadota bacterium]|nr:IS66 family transposase [Pseudomonadota bacterium]